MKQDSRLSRLLHVLIHMENAEGPMTSEQIAQILSTNPVVVRRTLGHLREKGFVDSAKGHGGGWVITKALSQITLLDVYKAIGSPELFALGLSSDSPTCLVEKAVNSKLSESLERAERALLSQFKEVTIAQIAKSVRHGLRHHKGHV